MRWSELKGWGIEKPEQVLELLDVTMGLDDLLYRAAAIMFRHNNAPMGDALNRASTSLYNVDKAMAGRRARRAGSSGSK